MILEGIVTTINEDDTTNVSPMGPIVDGPGFDAFVLRPFQTSTTYKNLKRHGEGVLHVTDDVLLLARGAIGKLDESTVEVRDADSVNGRILRDTCQWITFRVTELDDSTPRTTIRCHVVEKETEREFFGFNRAKHAVLEAAILATRIEFLEPEFILTEFERLKVIVEKTAGTQEHAAYALLDDYLRKALSNDQ